MSFEENSKNLKKRLALELKAEEVADYFKYFQVSDLNDKNADILRSLYIYSANDPKVRIDLLHELSLIHAEKSTGEKNKDWKQFIAHKKRVDLKKLKIVKKGGEDAFAKSEFFEKLYYSCKTQIKAAPNPADISQAKRMTYALTAGALSSSTITYAAVHWDEEKNNKWYNELAFSLAITGTLSFIGGKLVLSDPKLSPWTGKMPLTYASKAFSDGFISGIYGYLFNTSNSEVEKKVNEILNNPESKEELEELLSIAKEKKLFEKHLKDSQNKILDKKTNLPLDIKNGVQSLTLDDIDLEETREVFIEAMVERIYQENAGPLSVGSPSLDRYSYHRLYSLASVPAEIGVSIMMYNQLCMTKNPKEGFLKAMGLYMGVSLLFDALYFKARKDLINQ